MNRISAAAVTLVVLSAACGGSRVSPARAGATLEGTVLTASSSNLSVSVPGTARATTTDSAGHFALLDLPAGASSLHFSGGGVDATLHIAALSQREHRSIRVDVKGHDASEHQGESESTLSGAIDSITAPSFLVGGRTVTTTTATTFQKSGAQITFTDLSVGDSVEAEGAVQTDGSLLARTVRVEDANQESDGGPGGSGDQGSKGDVEFTGALTAVAGARLTVGSNTVTVDASTRIEKADQTIAAAALAVGDKLRVQGTLQADSTVLATEIKVLTAAEQAQVMVTGPVAAVSAADQTFTIGTTLIKTDAHTSFSGHGSLADLKIGDVVDVEAALQADGSLLALSIHRLEKPETNEVEVKGAIEQLAASSIQVQGKAFAVDAKTEIRQSGKTLLLSDLKTGQVAEVRGETVADGSLLATRISLESGN